MHQTMELMRLLVSLLFLMVCRAPGPAANLSVTFREDTKHLQHAIFDFTWTPPPGKLALTKCASLVRTVFSSMTPDIDVLEGYRLVIEHAVPADPDSNQHNCSLTQETVSENVSRVRKKFKQ